MKLFNALLLTLVIQTSKAQECLQDLLDPANSLTFCIVENVAACGEACTASPNLDLSPTQKTTCTEMEDMLCPSIRCCDACWEVSQKNYQCTAVDASIAAGLVETGCTLDCTRFPIGASNPPTTAPIMSNNPPSPTPEPTFANMAPLAPTDPSPTDMPTATKTCDEDAEQKKFDDCVAANRCEDDATCFSRIGQVQFDTSKVNDICAYFEPALCIVDACCSQCSDEYRNALSCAAEGSVLGCTNLSCSNAVSGGPGTDSGAVTPLATTTVNVLALAIVASTLIY